MKEQTANWFHEKWSVTFDAYPESMNNCLTGKSVSPNGMLLWRKAESSGTPGD